MTNGDSRETYEKCLRTGQPYFGGHLAALQGSVARHAFMRQLVAVEAQNPREKFYILEIGSWAGGSAVTWAKAIQEFYSGHGYVFCIDPWMPFPIEQHQTGQVMQIALETDQIFKLFLHNVIGSGVDHLVIPIRGESRRALKWDRLPKFDIIYIDGSHTYESVRSDIELSLPLLKEGGVLCGDDLELQAHEVDQPHMNAYSFRDYVEDPGTKLSYHPGVTRAVGESLGPVSCWYGFWAARRSNGRWQAVDLYELDHAKLKIPDHIKEAGEAMGQTFLVEESSGPEKTP